MAEWRERISARAVLCAWRAPAEKRKRIPGGVGILFLYGWEKKIPVSLLGAAHAVSRCLSFAGRPPVRTLSPIGG